MRLAKPMILALGALAFVSAPAAAGDWSRRGDLAVVQLAGRYPLVEREIALQAQAINAQALVLLCDPNAPAEDDVPADLVW